MKGIVNLPAEKRLEIIRPAKRAARRAAPAQATISGRAIPLEPMPVTKPSVSGADKLHAQYASRNAERAYFSIDENAAGVTGRYVNMVA